MESIIEDCPSIWEEEFALQNRDLIIDERVFKDGIKYTAEKLKQYFDKYNTGLTIKLDMDNEFTLKIVKGEDIRYQINFDYTEAMCIIKLVGTEYFITLSVVDSMYVIKYFNMNVKQRIMYFINEETIEGLLRDLLIK